jgi:putative FmdB family regulatory protein
MPEYSYECPGCGEVELEHSMNTNRNEQVCPICGVDVEPLVVGVQLSATAEFRQYKLESGNLKAVEGDAYFDNGLKSGKRGVHIQSKKHEKAIMEKMGCRFAETGDSLLGNKFGEKPDKKIHIRR